MEEKDSWGLTEEEIKERLRQQNQKSSKTGPTRGGRSSGQGVKLLYIRDYLYAHATKEHPKKAREIITTSKVVVCTDPRRVITARRKILCKRFSTKSRISRFQCA